MLDSVLFQVAAAISVGAILIAPTHSVGPYLIAVSAEPMWSCLDLEGAPIPMHEEWDETIPFFSPINGKPLPQLSGKEPRLLRDWSAFAAARAFVDAVGEEAALSALAQAFSRDPGGSAVNSRSGRVIDKTSTGRPACEKSGRVLFNGSEGG